MDNSIGNIVKRFYQHCRGIASIFINFFIRLILIHFGKEKNVKMISLRGIILVHKYPDFPQT